MAPIRN